MAFDLAVVLFNATVRITQPLPNGRFGQATGFLVSDPAPDGSPRVVLVTANHVFADKMQADTVQLGLREQDAGGGWRYAPQPLTIRRSGAPLWTRHPAQDVAALVVQVPPDAARAAIPLTWLADADTFDRVGLVPGDPMFVLGYPMGLSAAKSGFAILRAGHVASYPLTPVADHPTFLADAEVFAGNSGGPVFVGDRAAAGGQFVAGLVSGQVEAEGARLGVAVVVHAALIRETLALLDAPAPAPAPPPADSQAGLKPMAAPFMQ